MLTILVLFLCISQIQMHQLHEDAKSIEAEIEESLKEYHKNDRPRPISHLAKKNEIPEEFRNSKVTREDTLVVEISMFLLNFGAIDVTKMEYTVTLLLRQRWKDPRISIGREYNISKISLTTLHDKIWLPDLFFQNAKSAKLHTITKPNIFLWVDKNDVITYSQKITVTLSCYMDLWRFPFDEQNCPLRVGSFGESKDDVAFRWWANDEYDVFGRYLFNQGKSSAVKINTDLNLNEFELKSHQLGYCTIALEDTEVYTCLNVQFLLERKYGFHIVYTYMPTFIILLLSWLSFFIDYKAPPARVSICLLCVLALVTQSVAALGSLPRVSYVKALDVWLFGSLMLIMVTFFEYAFVGRLHRVLTDKSEEEKSEKFSSIIEALRSHQKKPNIGEMLTYMYIQKENIELKEENDDTNKSKFFGRITPKKVDGFFIMFYPILIAMFVLCYTCYYATVKK